VADLHGASRNLEAVDLEEEKENMQGVLQGFSPEM
jgi:hypothetical protein